MNSSLNTNGDERALVPMTKDERNNAIGAEKEAPCYKKPWNWEGRGASGMPIGHEFAGGKCIWCGMAQPGHLGQFPEKKLDQITEGLL